MRNFGNESFVSQHYPLPPNHHHQQFALSSIHQHHLTASAVGSTAVVKQESYPLAKSIGVGTNLKQQTKSHFSPVNIVAPSAHHLPNHHINISGHHNSNNNNNNNNSSNNSNNNSNNPNGIPINLSHGHTTTTATTTMISSSSETNSADVGHLPTAALTATCPSVNRGPSPAHHQQNPINGLPYHHSTHSPTLPVAHTALPTEVHIGSVTPGAISSSNRSSPLSVTQQISKNMPSSPYHHLQYHHMPINKGSPSTGTVTDLSQHNRCSPSLNSSNRGSPVLTAPEMTRTTHPSQSTTAEDSNSIAYRTNNNVTGTNNTITNPTTTARMVGQNVNGTLTITGIPTNDSELQLFRVLQRANLLSYFDLMIELGGDDVQQLCEAGKEEFLEIMGLIGMAAKPLHVRRLQKTLLEWKTQPSLFQQYQPAISAGYQQHPFGVSHVDPTVSHTTQYTTTIAAAVASNVTTEGIAHHHHHHHQQLSNHHHPLPVIPIPHLISHNPISPYPAQSAPLYALEPPNNSPASTSTDSSTSSRLDFPAHNNNLTKNVKSNERSSNNSSPSLSSNTTAGAIVGLDKVYLQRGSPSIPVVISTAQTYNNLGQQGLSSSSSSLTEHYQNYPSPSGSTSSSNSSSSSRSSTVSSIKSHHQFHHSSSPLENSPDSPVNSESGRSNKHEESNSSTCTELENSSSSPSSPSDQSNSIQLLDNSTGTGILRVASRSSSYCGSIGGGSEPSSPAPPPPPPSFSKGILISSSSSQQTRGDSPRPSTESVTNRGNNTVAVTATTSSQDLSSLQQHEIQKLAETAMNLVRSLPHPLKEPKLSKKIETSSYEFILRLAEDDPRRMDEIRRLSAVFGKIGEHGKRSSSKGSFIGSSTNSSSNKSMSILELAMNEAAAQLCKLVPALLTKRDEMFSLARQVIRDSGLPYSMICANSNLPHTFLSNHTNSSNYNDGNVATSGFTKGIMEDIRNSPAHEERISFEFAAACKKIKLDMHNTDAQENESHRKSTGEGRRKSPPKEDKIVTATALKRMAMATSEYRRNCKSAQTTSLRT